MAGNVAVIIAIDLVLAAAAIYISAAQEGKYLPIRGNIRMLIEQYR